MHTNQGQIEESAEQELLQEEEDHTMATAK